MPPSVLIGYCTGHKKHMKLIVNTFNAQMYFLYLIAFKMLYNMKLLTSFLVLFLILQLHQSTSGQGITFSTKSFEEVLAQAKAENKPVFVDVYTKSCGPCRKMDKEVFPDQAVGKFFNDSLINFKLDAGDNQYKELLDKCYVAVYPTYLFFAPTGQLVYKTTSYKKGTDLIADAAVALKQAKSKKPLAVWDQEYLAQKNDTAFLIKYIKKRIYAGVPAGSFINDYLKLIKPDDWYNEKIIRFLSDNAYTLPATGLCYELASKSCDLKFGDKTNIASQELLDYFLANYSMGVLEAAIKSKSESTLDTAISIASCIKDPMLHAPGYELEFKKGYFYAIGDFDEFMAVTQVFIKDYILPTDNKLNRDTLSTIISLNKGASEFCNHTSSKSRLKKAIEWSDLAIELSSKSPILKPEIYWQCLDTKANLLSKTGDKINAVIVKKQALEAIPVNEYTGEFREKLKSELEKMQEES